MGVCWRDWVHAMWSARGQWLPGDARGFRDHDHRVHSSGSDERPPPRDEHVGLRLYATRVTRRVVFLPDEVRGPIAEALAEKRASLRCATRIIAVDGVHVHALFEIGEADAKAAVVRAKQQASHRVRARLPGSIWAQGCHVVRIEGEQRWRCTVDSIAAHGQRGAELWQPERFRASIAHGDPGG